MVHKARNIWKEFEQTGALNALIPVFAFLDEHTFLTKSGDLGIAFRVRGVDYECLDPSQVDHVARRFEVALRSLTEDYRFYQYLLKRNCPSIPYRTYGSPVVDKAIKGRMAFLADRSDTLYSLDLYFVLLYEGLRTEKNWRQTLDAMRRNPVSTISERLSGGKAVALLDFELMRAMQTLRAKANGFLIQIQDFLRAEILEKHDTYRFLARLTNYAPYRSDSMQLKFDAFLDQQLAGSALECQRDHLQLQDHAIRILSVTEPPAQTFANMLHALMELPSNAIVVSEWKRADNFKIRKLIRSKRRHHHNSKTSLTNYLSDSQPSERSNADR